MVKKKSKEKEQEIRVRKHRIFLGEKNIIFIIANGGSDEEIAKEISGVVDELLSSGSKKMDLFVDLSNAGKPTPAARKMTRETFEDKRIGKVALIGMNPVSRVLASFVMGITTKKEMRFFGSEEDALAWLKDKRSQENNG